MFGVVRPCRHRLSAPQRKRWAGHLCGLCLTLRDEVGQGARLATNYDGLLLSVLVEDLAADGVEHRTAGPCPLRGMRTATVVASNTAAARLAASVSLLLAATKMADHVDDGQAPRVFGPIARRWEAAGRRLAKDVGFDPASVLDPVADQARLEAVTGRDLCSYTAPSEAATSSAFAHAAVLSGRQRSRPGLAAAGKAFGRLAHLLDAVEDEADDRKAARFNPLVASGTPKAEARIVAENCIIGLREGLAAAGVAGSTLAHRLVVHEASHAVMRTFDGQSTRSSPVSCLLVPCSTCTGPAAFEDNFCSYCGCCCGCCTGCCNCCD